MSCEFSICPRDFLVTIVAPHNIHEVRDGYAELF